MSDIREEDYSVKEEDDLGLDSLDLDNSSAATTNDDSSTSSVTLQEQAQELKQEEDDLVLEKRVMKEISMQDQYDELSTVPQNFYNDINKYLKIRENGSIGSMNRRRIRSSIDLLIRFRIDEMLKHSSSYSSSISERLCSEEKAFYRLVCDYAEKFRNEITNKVLNE